MAYSQETTDLARTVLKDNLARLAAGKEMVFPPMTAAQKQAVQTLLMQIYKPLSRVQTSGGGTPLVLTTRREGWLARMAKKLKLKA